ncbi:MAG: esterase-like activity of phytase family protein [Chitinophagaceae bacterium]|nr:esterase-like activity of phytase family protein [Chitinophagaceae bacterium]
MQIRTFHLSFYCTLVLLAISCTSTKRVQQSPVNISGLKYVSTYDIPFNLAYKQTVVGGLSGIDYDAQSNLYYIISDDRSEKNPARFYTAKLFFTPNGIDSLVFTGMQFLIQPDGTTYPNSKTDRFKTPDPEAIRYNSKTGQLAWSSEGERIVRETDTVLTDPAVFMMNKKGKYIDEFVLPGNLKMQVSEKGPRRNGVLEGLSFADDYKTLYVSAEEPLYEDGPSAGLTGNKAFIRIFKFDVAGSQGAVRKKSTAQYAYQLEPVAHAANPQTAFKINGVSEILNLGNNKLLVMERSFSTGRLPCTIKLFIADLNGATDIGSTALKNNTSFIPAKKTLLLNMDDLGIYTDNLEGITFGPTLPNGNRTLICIADNNFNILEKAQILLFEVLE